nr:AMP-binding protein [Methylomarinum sp. Ch1-1]MDP4522382.1 AMP-binding protein [Methylomarinum sp. Ch1-1]
MCAELTSLPRCALAEDGAPIIAVHRGQPIDRRQFSAEVGVLATALKQQPQKHYALYCDAAYPFAVRLFALLHAGKQVWIPGNNRPASADKLIERGCRLLGDWPGQESDVECVDEGRALAPLRSNATTPLDLQHAQLTLFTSGSSGEAKAIAKSLAQLQSEVEGLERQWGDSLGRAAAVATVSHQHIYGLLFRLLWPLAAGRIFHSEMFLSPEPMLRAVASTPAYWVASPAQLKRLDELSDWGQIAELSAIYSSGGPLPAESAKLIEHHSGQQVTEIYGSSETGGIGWRRIAEGASWTPFTGIRLTPEKDGCCRLASPYLPEPGHCRLDDRIDVHEDGRFTLLGRLDRIVKVEEKRLSLDELERALADSDWVVQAHCLLLSNHRDRIGVVVVLSASGQDRLQQGRNTMIRQLRKELMQTFETVVLPRKWLFIDALPLTPQGKIDNALLMPLLQQEHSKFPQLLHCRRQDNIVTLSLRIQPELAYFDGHFPEQPILPGVAQLAFCEHYGKLFLRLSNRF